MASWVKILKLDVKNYRLSKNADSTNRRSVALKQGQKNMAQYNFEAGLT